MQKHVSEKSLPSQSSHNHPKTDQRKKVSWYVANLPVFSTFCSSRKYPNTCTCTPPTEGIGISRGVGGLVGEGVCWKKSLLRGRFRYYLELNCHFMILPSMTSLALVLGRAVHIILINATRRLEIVTISEKKNRQFNYHHKHMNTCTSFSM